MALMWSRQTGKGFTAASIVNVDILDAEAQRQRTEWVLTNRSQLQSRQLARKVHDQAEAVVRARKMLQGPNVNDLSGGNFEIVYPGDSRVWVLSGHPDAAASFTANLVADEIDLNPWWSELLGTALPVASTNNLRALLTSTPRGKRAMYQVSQDAKKDGSPWYFEKLTIYEAVAQGCPQDPAFLRRAILNEVRWRQEYLCEFVDEDTVWLNWDLLVACGDPEATVEPAPFDGPVYGGWDIARYHHLSVCWIAGQVGTVLRPLGLLVMRNVKFEAQIERVSQVLSRYPAFTRLCMDETGMGEMPTEVMKRRWGGYRVEGVKFNTIKPLLAGDLRYAMEERNFLIFDDDEVRNDLHSIQQTFTAGNKPRFEGEAAGSHADRFWAAALCKHAARPAAGGWIARTTC